MEIMYKNHPKCDGSSPFNEKKNGQVMAVPVAAVPGTDPQVDTVLRVRLLRAIAATAAAERLPATIFAMSMEGVAKKNMVGWGPS